MLVNNAGVMAMPRSAIRDGFELRIATNHLGPPYDLNRERGLWERSEELTEVTVPLSAAAA